MRLRSEFWLGATVILIIPTLIAWGGAVVYGVLLFRELLNVPPTSLAGVWTRLLLPSAPAGVAVALLSGVTWFCYRHYQKTIEHRA